MEGHERWVDEVMLRISWKEFMNGPNGKKLLSRLDCEPKELKEKKNIL